MVWDDIDAESNKCVLGNANGKSSLINTVSVAGVAQGVIAWPGRSAKHHHSFYHLYPDDIQYSALYPEWMFVTGPLSILPCCKMFLIRKPEQWNSIIIGSIRPCVGIGSPLTVTITVIWIGLCTVIGGNNISVLAVGVTTGFWSAEVYLQDLMSMHRCTFRSRRLQVRLTGMSRQGRWWKVLQSCDREDISKIEWTNRVCQLLLFEVMSSGYTRT